MTFTHVECSDSGIWKGYVDIRGLNVGFEMLGSKLRENIEMLTLRY